eukprot:TRINITY_DN546_c0_g1_i9.p1 TRINITY_DN546_c0_g1~~TRINITY_DN546_c0_g1_i9.p1  ORF type:complete len:564 (+),score=91.24 TRINITY_DN546_c0_g1_i9:50-1741(+)
MIAETLSFVQSRIPQITRDWDSQPTDERILRVGLAFFLTLAIAGGIKQRFQRLQKEQSLSIGRRDIVGLALIAFFMNDLHLVVGPPAEWTEAVNKWWLQLVASMDPQTFFAVTIYGSLTTTCILFTAPYMMLDMLHLLGVPLFAQYKLQKRRPKWIDIWNCFKAVFMVYVGILFMTWTSYPVYKFCGVYADAPIPSWGRIGAELLLFLFIEDLGHFIFHWIFHIEPFYGWIHSVHHKHTYPFGLTATYSHPIEVIVLGIPTMIGPSLVKSHLFTFILWTNLRQWDAIETHSGYEFPWSLSKWLPLWGGAEFHDAHHAYKTSNYASSFTYLDTLFGTDAAYRKRKDKYEAEKEEEQTEKKAPKTPEKSQKQAVAKSPMKAAQTPKSAWDDWLPEDPSKRRAEIFFLWYSVVWISMVAVIIATQIYDVSHEFVARLLCCLDGFIHKVSLCTDLLYIFHMRYFDLSLPFLPLLTKQILESSRLWLHDDRCFNWFSLRLAPCLFPWRGQPIHIAYNFIIIMLFLCSLFQIDITCKYVKLPIFCVDEITFHAIRRMLRFHSGRDTLPR